MASIKSRPKTRLGNITKSWHGFVFRNITITKSDLLIVKDLEYILSDISEDLNGLIQ
jgi:hypothetical protein